VQTNPASHTIFVFSFYPLGAGIFMFLLPSVPLELLGLPVEGTDWIRMLGIVTTLIGYYYFNNGRKGALQFARFTVHGRISMPFIFGTMVLAFDMNPLYVAFTAIDVLGGLWTWKALQGMQIPVWRDWNEV